MKITVVGLNHKTAPVDVRERLAFDAAQAVTALGALKSRFADAEFVLLSTCNRVELYCARQASSGPEAKDLAEFLAESRGIVRDDFEKFLYVHHNEEAVKHLLAVGSGLDSMVVGEAQIIGQVKDSYRLACEANSTGKVLNRLFHCSFAVFKKVHSATSISTGRVSVAGVAVELATQLFEDISSAKVVVIGAGQMGESLLRHLLHSGCKNITIVNRSYPRGLNLARRFGIKARKWEKLDEQLAGAHIAIASAAAQECLFSRDSLRRIVKDRGRPLLIIDIAVPRNFEPAAGEIENVYLYSIDDLSRAAEENLRSRRQDIAQGTEIISKEAAEFMDWFRARNIGPLIGRMKEKFAQISQDELERFYVGTRQDASCRDATQTMVRRLVNRLSHCVIKNIDAVCKERGPAEAAKLVQSIIRQAEELSHEADNKEKVGREA